MASTLMEAARSPGANYTSQEMAVIQMFTQVSPVLETLPFDPIDGASYTFTREDQLPAISWRAVNAAWAESTGTTVPFIERLMIMGGEFKVDRFILKTQPKRALSEWVKQAKMKTRAAANEFDRAFFQGSDLSDVNEMVGLRRRLTGDQVLYFGAAGAGAALTLDQLDEAIDAVPFGRKVIYMNRWLRRKLTRLINASTGARQIIVSQDQFGKQIERYGEAEIRIIERTGDASTLLDFDEDAGNGSAITASLYICSYVDGYGLKGLYASDNGKSVEVEDFGILQSEPRRMGRIEAYFGMAMEHPRAAARLRGIAQT